MDHSYQTKRRLADALKEQMTHMAFNKITVQSISDACGVNRQTFYYHFSNMYSLLGWIFKFELFEEVAQNSNDSWENQLRTIMQYARQNKDFCSNAVRYVSRKEVERFLYPFFYRMTRPVVDGISLEEEKDFYAQLFAGMLINYGIRWVEAGCVDNDTFVLRALKKLYIVIRASQKNLNRVFH